ncbi:AIP3-domain-containing protein [Microstroma glucosiphilum]|uniref:AIP3-domain-containing protein n=1 Tax=Pseudomicrostroma glucosiphilum TaxID=1684307 RepID=A0A316UCL1_9BASI|nr:AIP3-domain-containing protein [Pseudomicrostroma glucosiphilum]PWN22929.1 AIP3-domain-containing protein [Pseudomicrostroma glucosiphilum]
MTGPQPTGPPSRSPYSSNHMESSVTRLLVATKLLLEALTQWSIGQRSETDVSDVYVRLGNDFHSARVAFHSYGIDMSVLASVPDDLRGCLERCLSEDASPAVLDQHLPRVREIIVRLLQGLKVKQAEYKRILVAESQQRVSYLPEASQSSADAGRPSGPRSSRTLRHERQGTSEGQGGMARLPEESRGSRHASLQKAKSEAVRSSGSGTMSPPSSQDVQGTQVDDDDTPMPSSNGNLMESSVVPANVIRHSLSDQPSSRGQTTITPSSSLTGRPASPRSAPASAIRPGSASTRVSKGQNHSVGPNGGNAVDITEADPSLRALKSRDALERRASKRFSAYTFNKMGLGQGFGQSFGSGSLGMSMLSMGAGSGNSPSLEQRRMERKNSQKQRGKGSMSESNLATILDKAGASAAEEEEEELAQGDLQPDEPTTPEAVGRGKGGSTAVQRSPVTRRTSAGSGSSGDPAAQSLPSSSRTSHSELPPIPPVPPIPSLPLLDEKGLLAPESRTSSKGSSIAQRLGPSALPTMASEESGRGAAAQDEQGSLQVFLQLGRQTRKATLDTEGGVSIATLKMLFIDRFAYSPGKDDFPAIYIKDPFSGVTYELENLHDVTEGCLLTLNIEPLDQVKQHLDLSLGALSREIREIKTALSDRDRDLARRASTAPPNAASMHLAPPAPGSPSRFSDSQFAAAGHRVASLRPPSIAPTSEGDAIPIVTAATDAHVAENLKAHYDEIQNLRREMAVLRQLQAAFTGDVGGLLKNMKEQTSRVRAIAATEVPAERNFIVAGKSRLDGSSQEVLTLIEDLQDTVDDLKLDVIQRGVKPKPATLKKIKDNIAQATRGLEDLEKYVQTVKPSWKKTWEAELQNIVDEQEFLNHQEGLIGDLRDDHLALQEVYENIQQVVKLRSAGRPAGGKYIPPAPEEGHEGLSTVMLEVRGQSVDHEKRLRALQAAERSRQREIASRTDDFTQELSGFVHNVAGDGLRKTGGHVEAERIRSKRDKATLLAMFGAGGAGGAPVEATAGMEKPKKLILGGSAGGGGQALLAQRSTSSDSRCATPSTTSHNTGTASASEEGGRQTPSSEA